MNLSQIFSSVWCGHPKASKKIVVWKLRNRSASIASTRYRCLLPIRWLMKSPGPRHVLIDDRDLYPPLDLVEVIVFVKSFGARDLNLARRAFDKKIPIIIDLCDNVFFNPDHSLNAANFKVLASLATRVITTNNGLAEIIQTKLGAISPPISCIDDPVESLADRSFVEAYQKGNLSHVSLKWWEAILMHLFLKRKKDVSENIFYSLGVDKIWGRFLLRQIHSIPLKCQNRAKSITKRYWTKLKGIERRCRTKLKSVERRCWKKLKGLAGRFPGKIRRVIKNKMLVVSDCGHNDSKTQTLVSLENRLPMVLWFGHSGVPGIHGITDLLDLKSGLERLYQKRPYELVVCTNSRQLFEQHLCSLKLQIRFVPWSSGKLNELLLRCDVVIVPNPMNEFTKVKSANRTLVALELGKPVVATLTESLEPLKELVYLSDWENNLQRALDEEDKEKQIRSLNWKKIRYRFESQNMAKKWMEILPKSPDFLSNEQMLVTEDFKFSLNPGELI